MDLYSLLRPLLFGFEPEKAHRLTFAGLRLGGGVLSGLVGPSEALVNKGPINVAGLRFRNRIGLAAGLDKNALCLLAWEKLGFGHVEIGTVTPLPQPGNPTPRLFRLPADQALINRMGFNNDGVHTIARRLENRPSPDQLIVGGNIGKNKSTGDEDAYKDYIACLAVLHAYVDYFTINVSSPNTPGLRNLQAREPLRRLLLEVQDYNQSFGHPQPIFIKIAPDLDDAALEDIVSVAAEAHLVGIVATNTTLSRQGLTTSADEVDRIGSGGLSGFPLKTKAQGICERIARIAPQSLFIIGSGGIMTAEDAEARLSSGASLIQLYTGLIYRGPVLVEECLHLS